MNGLLLVDKPAGLTSHDVVAKVREQLGVKKTGHAGTLDPQATGLLVLAIGDATRWLSYLPDDKRYEATLTLGIETDTEDIWGNELKRADASSVADEALKQTLLALKDSKEQVPPMISALKHQGRRLYSLARSGVEVERKARPMEIFELSLGERRGVEMDFEVHCGTGTYVRSLCAEVGKQLGVGACLSKLRRTAVGVFSIQDAVQLKDLNPESLIGAELALKHLKAYTVAVADETPLAQGQDLNFEEGAWDEAETYRLLSVKGELLGLGYPRRAKSGWRMQPKKVFSKA